MSNELLMPELSPTMTEGIVSRWLVSEGSIVSVGDIIAEIETDKVTVEYESPIDGVVQALLVEEGATEVAVGSTIALFGGEKEALTILQLNNEVSETDTQAKAEALPVSNNERVTAAETVKTRIANVSDIELIQKHTRISPLARRMAFQAELDISQLCGSGEEGRITKDDIRKTLGILEETVTVKPSSTNDFQFEVTKALLPEFEEVALTSMRKTVADRLSKSSQFVPHFYMTADCDMEQLFKLRNEINERFTEQQKLSVNDFIIKATAIALQQVPEANVMWDSDKIFKFLDVDISIAVAIDDGLITPVIKSCLRKGLRGISQTAFDLVAKAKSGRLKLSEFQGGTFTISNLGMYGIKEFTSIINPPQSGILSIGAALPKAVVKNGELAIATMMTITLAMDHRCVDGATGAKLINRIQSILQNPIELML